ncbi:MAG: hypothetical protein J0I19_16715 [Alphaproteobacteria bacterium]|nr:hypothetical protein [Alphaproteobacteria bacterium]
MLKKRIIADDALVPREIVEEHFPNLPKHSAHLKRWEENGFPPAVKLGYRTKVWPLAAVLKHKERLVAATAKKAASIKPKRTGGRHA